MSWLWEDYRDDGEYRVAWRPRSPSLEIGFEPSLVNVIPRFNAIFEPLGVAGIIDNAALEDVLLRFLTLLDFKNYKSRIDIYRTLIDGEIDGGLWGAEVAENYRLLNRDEKLKALDLCYEMERGGAPPLDRAVSAFFPGTTAYKIIKNGEILLSLPQEGTDAERARLALVLDLFAPLKQIVRPYWRLAPCLLDQESRLGHCVLD